MPYLIADQHHSSFLKMIEWFEDQPKPEDIPTIPSWLSSLGEDGQRQVLLGKTTDAHTKGTSQAVDIYGFPGETQGSETVITSGGSNFSLDVYNRFADVEDDKWVFIINIGSGYELVAAEC